MAKNNDIETVTATEEQAETPSTGTAIQGYKPQQSGVVQYADMSEGIPDMEDMDVAPLDLASTYWTPEAEGESKRLLFDRFAESMVPDKYGPNKNDPDATVKLETAHFWEMKDGQVVAVRQASKVLLSTLRSLGAASGAMLQIVYRGKKKLSNGNTGDTWSVFPLVKRTV